MTVSQIRRGLLAGAAVLVLVVAAFLGWERLRTHGFRIELPGRLGANIAQTADGFTYSQSQKGHTLFTIHASKVIELKGEQAELNEVTITLYGPPGSGRTDTIHGAKFSYDRKLGIARADGAVSIDLTSPPGKGSPQAGAIHVTTSGLVFNQATGAASTAQKVDFDFTQASGSALGADYNAKTGVLVLNSEVELIANARGRASGQEAVLRAAHAELSRDAHQAYLIRPEGIDAGERSSADQATLTFRTDGSAQLLEARGHVRLTGDDGSQMHSGTAEAELDANSRPTVAHLGGGVTYNRDRDGEAMQGVANRGTLAFDTGPASHAQVQLKHAQFLDAVSFTVQQRSYAGNPNGSSTREVRGSRLEVDFAPGPGGRAEAQRALAQGGAGFTLHDIPAQAPARNTAVTGDQLVATLADGRRLTAIDGMGNTKIVDSTGTGVASTSSGDTLHLSFASPSGRAASQAAGATQLEGAVQTGHVQMMQPAPADPEGAERSGPLTATAERVEYRAADQILHLSGDPHLRRDALAIAADRIDYHRESGDAAALGNVRATYAKRGADAPAVLGGEGPAHIAADHAEMARASGLSVFHGGPGEPARMWQGANSVEAPVLELSKDGQSLNAHSADGGRAGAAVHAALGAAGKPRDGGGAPGAQSAPVRVWCRTLRYAERDRIADLRGDVTAEQPASRVRADQAQIYLTPAAPDHKSSVDHMVAAGHVVVTQPGRRATGDRLVYTGADARYVLTGSSHEPPRVTDSEKGTTSGAALIFRGGDASVEVSGQGPQPSRTVTDTHTSK